MRIALPLLLFICLALCSTDILAAKFSPEDFSELLPKIQRRLKKEKIQAEIHVDTAQWEALKSKYLKAGDRRYGPTLLEVKIKNFYKVQLTVKSSGTDEEIVQEAREAYPDLIACEANSSSKLICLVPEAEFIKVKNHLSYDKESCDLSITQQIKDEKLFDALGNFTKREKTRLI